MKTYFILATFVFISCSKDDLQPENGFNLFNSQNLKFEYYSNYNDPDEYPVSELNLKLVADVELNDKNYHAFYQSESDCVQLFFNRQNEPLAYNFLPIRSEKGNYYELRWGGEVLILKDEMLVGDMWSSIISGDQFVVTHTFEVMAVIEDYSEFGIAYNNVYKIKEVIHSTDTGADEIISYHYYNKKYGIIRRGIPHYQSGLYTAITFNRIIL